MKAAKTQIPTPLVGLTDFSLDFQMFVSNSTDLIRDYKYEKKVSALKKERKKLLEAANASYKSTRTCKHCLLKEAGHRILGKTGHLLGKTACLRVNPQLPASAGDEWRYSHESPAPSMATFFNLQPRWSPGTCC